MNEEAPDWRAVQLWNELRRLANRAALNARALSEKMINDHGYPGRGASKTALYKKMRARDEDVFLEDKDFVRAFVLACYDGSMGPAGKAELGVWGTLQEWETWRQTLENLPEDTSQEIAAAHRSPLPQLTPPPPPRALSKAAIEKLEQLGRVLGNTGVYTTLRSLYPNHQLVDLWGQLIPICVYPAPQHQWDNIEAPLGQLRGSVVPAADDYDDAEFDRAGIHQFIELNRAYQKAKRSNPEQLRYNFPGATFAFDRLTHRDGGPKLDAFLSRYFHSAATSERLDAELMQEQDRDNRHKARIPLSELLQRANLHRRIAEELEPGVDPIETGRFRAAALSHAAVVMLATGDGSYDILLPERSADVAFHAGFRHVAPSGIFAPFNARVVSSAKSRRAEFSVLRNFYREWVEELFDAEAYEGWQLEDVGEPLDPTLAPEVARLQEDFDQTNPKRRGDLLYTGVSVNLLTLRPEICLLLVVDDPRWLGNEIEAAKQVGRPFRLGWEYAEGEIEHSQPKAKYSQLKPEHRLRLGPDLQPVEGSSFRAIELVPNAAAAIYLALNVMRTRRSRA
ncbi:hypothetical protein SAMN05216276_107848 [Streptosporangium subroseum]|uniref:Uncharacterized protein n=1 Tax=Streptosporangium subroseum TaxID=106412 RepID=A0A239P0Q0_9ACTN|nr:hypothetical protein [Streptosporangium subroseum]SNT60675.1 hypothetical protein SAMN05216276_107848 [Streptosporangium subroseum]